jgi:predicted DsbA family dithiol-disulfide isomerase
MLVEIWSDVVCPWCYIGKRRFEAAMARFAHRDEVQLVWRSFELDPTAAPSSSASPGRYAERLAAKYGRSIAEAQRMIDTMTATAAAEGLDFRFDLARPGNTFDAHRLLHLALEHGIQDELKERLDRATFTEGVPVSEHEAFGHLPRTSACRRPRSTRCCRPTATPTPSASTRRRPGAYGITGVPFFVLDGRYGISGAQPADVILQGLEQAWAERTLLTLVTAGAQADGCEGDTCAV